MVYAELYHVFACVFRRFGKEMVLQHTVFERDVKDVRDYFLPVMSKEGRGVRVDEGQVEGEKE